MNDLFCKYIVIISPLPFIRPDQYNKPLWKSDILPDNVDTDKWHYNAGFFYSMNERAGEELPDIPWSFFFLVLNIITCEIWIHL